MDRTRDTTLPSLVADRGSPYVMGRSKSKSSRVALQNFNEKAERLLPVVARTISTVPNMQLLDATKIIELADLLDAHCKSHSPDQWQLDLWARTFTLKVKICLLKNQLLLENKQMLENK